MFKNIFNSKNKLSWDEYQLKFDNQLKLWSKNSNLTPTTFPIIIVDFNNKNNIEFKPDVSWIIEVVDAFGYE